MANAENEVSLEDLTASIQSSEASLDARAGRLWASIRVDPVRWSCAQYPGIDPWVVALTGSRCLYFNEMEEGFGWGGYTAWGSIDSYHWEVFELHQVVNALLQEIDDGSGS